MKNSIHITGEIQRSHAIEVIRNLPLDVVHTVTISERKKSRSLEANAKLWAMLADISRQIEWHGRYLTSESWKDIFTAGLKKQEVVPGLDNNFVVLGAHTSKMSVAEMAELIELITAFGCQRGIKWSDPQYQD